MTRDSSVYCSQGPEHLDAIGSGPLNGKSFVFKDLFDVEGFTTGAGNPKWLETHEVANRTSPLILSLLMAGAECHGRVQTDELAYSLNGDNQHYGTPVNPKAPECLPGGSSSGSAVAVARGDADFSIGTDTGGSVRVPASYCGLYGLRPSHGELSLDHSFELAKSFDTPGIFTRDLALLKDVFHCLKPSSDIGKPVRNLLLDSSLKDMLGGERKALLQKWVTSSKMDLIEVDFLSEQGLSFSQLSLLFRQIQGYEIIEKHSEWLDKWQSSLAPAISTRVDWARDITKQEYQDAKHQQQIFSDAIEKTLELGLWLLPTTPGAPPKLDTPANELAEYRTQLMGLTSLAGLGGLPQLHIPMTEFSSPQGISLVGRKNSDSSLIATAELLTQGGII